MESKTISAERVANTLGQLSAKVEGLEEEMRGTRQDIREIRDTLTGVKGSWKTLVAVGSIISGILVAVGYKIIDMFGFGNQ
ncbi:MAG: hypothetical protein WD512_18315 [Candidatus Paceibacterota bacterium]